MIGALLHGLRFRRLRRRERRLLLDHFGRLSDEDIYRRFQTHMDTEDLRAHVDRKTPEHECIGFFDHGKLRGAIELVYSDDRAEGGLTVEPNWRDHGVGTELLRRGLRRAQRRGVRSLALLTFRGNIAMMAIANDFGGRLMMGHGHLIERPGDEPSLPAWIVFDLREDGETMRSAGFGRRAWRFLLRQILRRGD